MLIENEFLVTYEKDTQIDSSEELDRFKSIFHNSTYVSAKVSFAGRIKYINSILPSILGVNQDSFLNKKATNIVLDYVHPQDVDITIQALGDVVNGQRINGIENRYRARNGDYI